MAELPPELQYSLLQVLERNPKASQRQISSELGISLGKVNYCLKALINTGFLKAQNFRNSHNKLAYVYYLTPRGLEKKAAIAMLFLKQKLAEVEALRREVDEMQARVTASGADGRTAQPGIPREGRAR